MPPRFFYGGHQRKGLQKASVLSGCVLLKQPNNKSVQNWALCRTGPLLPTRPLSGLPSCGKGLTPGVSQAPRAALLPWQPSGIAARFLPHTEPQGGKKMIFPFSFWAGPVAKQPGGWCLYSKEPKTMSSVRNTVVGPRGTALAWLSRPWGRGGAMGQLWRSRSYSSCTGYRRS